MKRFLVCLIFALSAAVAFAQTNLPFSKGVNMLYFLETWNGSYTDHVWDGGMPDLNRYDEDDFACLKSMGVDVIRLTCSFDIFTDETAGTGNKNNGAGKINKSILEKLDEVCDWAEKHHIYLILDNHNNHTFGAQPKGSDNNLLTAHLNSVFTQLAQRYKDRSEYIIFEIMNEPCHEKASEWYKIQQEVINTIRQHDSKRTIIVSGIDYSSLDELIKLKPYKDSNLIYTFHFYEPWVFTHQGNAGSDIEDLEGLPFPYDKSRMPKLKGRIKGSWVQGYIENEYKTQGSEKFINARIKKAADWAKKNKVNIYCGEIGNKIWINSSDRIAWAKAVTSALKENNIPYTTWGIGDSNGFLKDTEGLKQEIINSQVFPDDIDQPMLEAYGFSMPDSAALAKINSSLKEFPNKPYKVYFNGITGKGSSKDFYGNIKEAQDSERPGPGMKVSYPFEYQSCKFHLSRIIAGKIAENHKNLSISLSVKFTNKNQEFRLILQDSDGGENELPWRKSVTIKAADYPVGKWTTIEIPLSKFSDSWGTWSEVTKKWYDLESKFDWSRFSILYFDFDDPDKKLTGDIFFDEVVIKRR